MLDTMTFTKAAGGICGALLVFLLGKWAAEELYHVEMHGEASYVIEVESGEDTAEVEEVDFATIMASASVEDGAKVFRKCSACHKLVEGENVAGPYLYGVVGRDKAAAEGYGYSDALASMEGAWTPENLSGFLEKPSSYAPGTSMGFAGLRKVEDRANVIAYLDSLDD
ncbi:cytochrome c family protein [Roseobacter denitrificans]|uniref:Cytochrome c552 n=1 Tax=Roseobacter denitrificans (strain ATCC 33942 / OCh 114) TaxID=375451 RepID=Q16AT5_ROSDO|nr:cytochrome c family protein [Roseobacter denitrificans]ABG30908.1 cytochrome c552 [Roseobacter denitrificans OCh 114]AVL54002.1 cytochrome c family protein [Roseobacter denitrificans]SFG14342.1 cytochrome c [Roseobacter denitrificans OCh 114]